jgi:hypothetical protein
LKKINRRKKTSPLLLFHLRKPKFFESKSVFILCESLQSKNVILLYMNFEFYEFQGYTGLNLRKHNNKFSIEPPYLLTYVTRTVLREIKINININVRFLLGLSWTKSSTDIQKLPDHHHDRVFFYRLDQ